MTTTTLTAAERKTTDNDLNDIIRQTVADTLSGMTAVMAAAAQEFAERTQEAAEDLREESADARSARRSERQLARISRLAREREAAALLVASADPASRAVLEARLALLDARVREAAGLPAEAPKALPALEAPAAEAGKVTVRSHTRRKGGADHALTNGTGVEN